MTPLICKCCGGRIDPVTMVCRYCDTAYVSETRDMPRIITSETRDIPRIITSEPVTITAYDTDGRKICDFETITEESAIMTPNEARKKIGLNSLANFGITAAEATKSFMNLSRAISLTCHHN